MPFSTNTIVQAATAEWNRWGNSTWNCITGDKSSGFHNDDEEAFARYVIDTYLPLFFSAPITWPSLANISNDDYPWSAVTISYIMKAAGFLKTDFPFSQAHATYLTWGIANRKQNKLDAAYWGYRVDEDQALPDVGDLVGCVRGQPLTRAQALAYFDKTGSYMSHADIVVAKRAGEIDVIGGNVRDSVTKKTLQLNNSGQLVDPHHDWFVVLKKRFD